VSVVDSQGQFKTVQVDVTPANSALRLAPASITLNESDILTGRVVSVVGGSIAGGASNPVRVFSSDQSRVTSTVEDNRILLKPGTRGNMCFRPGTDTISSTVTTLSIVITAVDDTGSSATMTLKINDDGGSTVCPE
jgi:hypothetical protein